MTLAWIVGALAAYRLTRLIILDTVTDGLRAWATSSIDSDKFTEFVTCPWCVGFYVCGVVTLLLDLVGDVPLPGLTWLAYSTIVGLLASNLDG